MFVAFTQNFYLMREEIHGAVIHSCKFRTPHSSFIKHHYNSSRAYAFIITAPRIIVKKPVHFLFTQILRQRFGSFRPRHAISRILFTSPLEIAYLYKERTALSLVSIDEAMMPLSIWYSIQSRIISESIASHERLASRLLKKRSKSPNASL